MDYLPFMDIEGNSLVYNRETSLGAADFYAHDGVWSEATSEVTQASSSLKILGGDVDITNFVQRTRSNVNDQKALQVALKSKSVARKFEQSFITGYPTNDANSFTGLKYLLTANGSPATSGQVLEAGTGGSALTLALLDQMIDLVLGGKPDILLMSKRTRRKLKALLQASAHYVETGDQFGRRVMMYDGIPVMVSDFVSDADTGSASGTALSSIYAIKFSAEDGLCGLQNGGIEVIPIGQLPDKDAERVRIRWYVALALFRLSSCARLSSINNS
jgi:hypothetical protein